MSDKPEGGDGPKSGGSLWRRILGAFAVLIVGLVVSAISGLYFDVSVSPPKSLSDVTSLDEIEKLLTAHLDFGSNQDWRGYIGESRGNMHHVEEMTLTLKQFAKTRRAIGETVSMESGDQFSTVGFLGGSNNVLVDLGRTGGVGTYILKSGASDRISGPIYFGYVLVEIWRDQPGGERIIDKCPFVLIGKDVAEANHMNGDKIADIFGFLNTPCSEFKMPMSLIDIDDQ